MGFKEKISFAAVWFDISGVGVRGEFIDMQHVHSLNVK
jgi:hypothetical protein